jgi:hypothetical protein
MVTRISGNNNDKEDQRGLKKKENPGISSPEKSTEDKK